MCSRDASKPCIFLSSAAWAGVVAPAASTGAGCADGLVRVPRIAAVLFCATRLADPDLGLSGLSTTTGGRNCFPPSGPRGGGGFERQRSAEPITAFVIVDELRRSRPKL